MLLARVGLLACGVLNATKKLRDMWFFTMSCWRRTCRVLLVSTGPRLPGFRFAIAELYSTGDLLPLAGLLANRGIDDAEKL